MVDHWVIPSCMTKTDHQVAVIHMKLHVGHYSFSPHIIPSINTCCCHPALLIRAEGRNLTETFHFYPFSEVTDQNFPDDGIQSSNDPCKKQKSISGTASNDQDT